MNKKLVFFAFLLITITTVLGQKKSVEILGKVTDSLGVVANAHIVNLQTKIGTFSKDNGSFLIPVQLGDSLSISSVQHQTSFLIVSGFVLKRKKIAIYLKSLVYRLDTFELKKHLASYMIPSKIIYKKSLPLIPSDKNKINIDELKKELITK